MKKRGLALFLSLVLLLSLLPVTAAAAVYTPETFTIVSRKTSTLAPGITQDIVYSKLTQNKEQMVYYLATLDLNHRDANGNQDVHIYSSYKDAACGEGKWGMSKLTDQIKSHQAKHSNEADAENYIPYYNVVGGINASFYNMSNGQPNGAFAMGGTIITRATGSFFAIRKDGSAVIGTSKEQWDTYNTAENPIVEAVGGSRVQIKDGKLTQQVTNSLNARTSIGITADGKVVMAVADGKQSPFSAGTDMKHMGEMLLEAGCVTAIELDGGGSTTYAARQEGSNTISIVNKPCDGSERAISSGLIFVSTTPPSTGFDHAVLTAEHDYVTPGSTVNVSAIGVTPVGTAADIPEDAAWAVADSTLGSVTSGGAFTSTGKTGDAEVQMLHAGKVVGKTTIHVVKPDALAFDLPVLAVPYGKSSPFSVTAKLGDHVVYYPTDQLTLALSDAALGSLNGFTFIACQDGENAPTGGTINAALAGTELTASIELNLGKGSEVIYDFEDGQMPESLLWEVHHTGYNVTAPESKIVTASEGKVHGGSYAFAGVGDWSNICDYGGCLTIQIKYQGSKNIDLSGAVGIGAWIWVPDEYKETNIRFKTVNGSGQENVTTIFARPQGKDFEAGGHWTYVWQDISSSGDHAYVKPGSFIQFELYASARKDPDVKSAANIVTFYVDDITVDYSSVVPDRLNPVFREVNLHNSADSSISLAKGVVADCDSGSVSFSASVVDDTTAEKWSGAVSGIDANSAEAFIDGRRISASCQNGTIRTEEVNLAAGVHTLKLGIADNTGNYGSVTRQIQVKANSDVPTVKVIPKNADLNNLQLGSVYYVDIVATDIAAIQAVDLKLDLNNISTWELEYSDIDPYFSMTSEVQTLIEGDNIATIQIVRNANKEAEERTGKAVLASLPIRVWKGDTTWTSKTVGQWPRDVSVEVDYGQITYAVGHEANVLPVFSAAMIQADTEINAWGNAVANSKWHTHTPTALEDKTATCTEDGYTGRTYCEKCNSVVEWGELTRGGHAWYIAGFDLSHPALANVLHCHRCEMLYNGEYTNPTYGIKQYYKDGRLYTGWVDDKYYANGTQQTAEFQMIENILYRFTDGVCEGQTPYTGEHEGKGYQDGAPHTGWLDNDCYYVDGVKQTDEFQEIGGKWYQFTDGVCKGKALYTGFMTREENRYYVELGVVQTGKMETNDEGQQVYNGWFQAGEETCHACEGKDGALGTVLVRDTRTCTQNGFKMFECETCHASKTGEALWAEGHKWDKESSDKNDPPTCSVCHQQGKYIGDVNITFSGSPYFIYTGQEIRAEHTVKDGDKVLSVRSDKQGADGLSSFQNNKEVGMATLHIDGRGDYYGSVEANFYIIPADVPAVRITKQDKTSVSLAWDEAGGAQFYSVFRKDAAAEDKEENWTLVTTTYKTTYKVEDLTFGGSYQFRVDGRANVTINGQEKQLPSANWAKTPDVTLAHQWDEPVVVEPTCTENGSSTRTCAHCGETDTEDLPKLGHDVAEWTVTKEPTIAEKGSKTGHCSRCDQDITVEIGTLTPYDITIAEPVNGTVTTDPETQAAESDYVAITATPDPDYVVDTITVTYEEDGETKTAEVTGSNTFVMPAADVTVTVTFRRVNFQVDVADTDNGAVTTTAEAGKAAVGSSVEITAAPDEDYAVDTITVTYEENGETKQAVVEDGRFTMPAADVTITATFKRTTFNITVSETENGTVTVPNKARAGETVTVTATPDDGYELDQLAITYDGSILRSATQILEGDTFTMPESDVTVTAVFTKIARKVTVKQPENGTVSAARKAAEGETVTVTATPDEDYAVDTVTVTYEKNGETKQAAVTDDHTFTMPAADVTVAVTFKQVNFRVNVADAKNGAVTTTAEAGKAAVDSSVEITAAPDADYAVDTVTVTYEENGETKQAAVTDDHTFTMPAADVTVAVTFKRVAFNITVSGADNGTVTVPDKARAGETVTVTAAPDPGYTLDRLEAAYVENGETKEIDLSGSSFTMPDADVTVTAHFRQVSIVKPNTEVKNPDGSTTKTETKTDGTKVETTTKTETKTDGTKVESTATVETKKDGTKVESTATVETKKDGTKVENTATVETKKDGTKVESKTVAETKADGSAVKSAATTTTNTDGSRQEKVVETTVKPDGTEEESVRTTDTKVDGSVEYAARQANGTTAAATVDAAGKMNAEAVLSEKAVAAAGEKPIVLPLPQVPVVTDRESAPTVKVELPAKTEAANVIIPVQKADPAAVAVIVHPDGTEEVVRKSIVTQDGLSVPLESGATLKVVSNDKKFKDVKEDDWASDAVSFASSRELFQGTGEGQFSPDKSMTRGMLVTVLYRLEQGNVDGSGPVFPDVPQDQWYSDAVSWAVKAGIVSGYSDGTFGGDNDISREQLAVLLYRYSGSPKVSGTLDFSDAGESSGWARDALIWAQQNKIMQGSGGKVRPKSGASRAEVAQLLMNFVNHLAAK